MKKQFFRAPLTSLLLKDFYSSTVNVEARFVVVLIDLVLETRQGFCEKTSVYSDFVLVKDRKILMLST